MFSPNEAPQFNRLDSLLNFHFIGLKKERKKKKTKNRRRCFSVLPIDETV